MKNFIRIRIRTTSLDAEKALKFFSGAFPSFKWRQGDSDMQGPYISGTNEDAVQLMMWLGEQPNDLTISFAGATSSEAQNRSLVDQLLRELTPLLGDLVEVLGAD